MNQDKDGIVVVDIGNTNKGLLVLLNVLIINKDDRKNYIILNRETEIEITDKGLSDAINEKIVDYSKKMLLCDDCDECDYDDECEDRE